MFHQTRLQLTFWYLLIIMVISMMFSLVIYRVETVELDRMMYQERLRQERINRDYRIPKSLREYLIKRVDTDYVTDAKERLIRRLLLINSGILVSASIAGYFLSGITLKPISDMISEQKRFVADASHELKTPLTSLRSEIEVGLRDKKMTIKDSKKLLKSNLEEVIRLQKLSDSLLLLSKNGSLKSQVYFVDVSLTDELNKVLIKLDPLIKKKKLYIEKEIEDIKIKGISDRIEEMFVILFDNAIKYSKEEGKIYITIKKTNNTAIISIKDEGIGIAAKDLPHIFERFYRADSSRTRSDSSGFGLGLAIAENIVKTHNGSIDVKSKVEKETEFIIKLPL